MSTLAKNLKDTNGNVILPKTRSEQVYRPNNTSVETSLINITTGVSTLTTTVDTISNKVNEIPPIDGSSLIIKCTHTKTDTVHALICDSLPTGDILHLSFLSTADYVSGDTFTINGIVYSANLYSLEVLPDAMFKTGTLVTIDIDVTNKLCFFKSGGVSGPPEEPTDEAASYSIIQAFTTDTTWTVPETKWYRIIAVGKSGNGGNGAGSRASDATGGSGAGGNAGGIACSTLLLEKGETIQITVNGSMTSFGPNITATVGGSGGSGEYFDGDTRYGANGSASTQYGDGFGGNKVNITGMQGKDYQATTNIYWGGYFQSDLPYINQYFVSADRIENYCAAGRPGKSYYQWVNLAVQLSGGGGGGYGGTSNSGGSSGGTGQPGVCIIEKAVR